MTSLEVIREGDTEDSMWWIKPFIFSEENQKPPSDHDLYETIFLDVHAHKLEIQDLINEYIELEFKDPTMIEMTEHLRLDFIPKMDKPSVGELVEKKGEGELPKVYLWCQALAVAMEQMIANAYHYDHPLKEIIKEVGRNKFKPVVFEIRAALFHKKLVVNERITSDILPDEFKIPNNEKNRAIHGFICLRDLLRLTDYLVYVFGYLKDNLANTGSTNTL